MFKGKNLPLAQIPSLRSACLVHSGEHIQEKPQSTGLGEFLDGLGSVCVPPGGAAGQEGSDSGDLISRGTVTEC